jgi:hypothetical protein
MINDDKVLTKRELPPWDKKKLEDLFILHKKIETREEFNRLDIFFVIEVLKANSNDIEEIYKALEHKQILVHKRAKIDLLLRYFPVLELTYTNKLPSVNLSALSEMREQYMSSGETERKTMVEKILVNGISQRDWIKIRGSNRYN